MREDEVNEALDSLVQNGFDVNDYAIITPTKPTEGWKTVFQSIYGQIDVVHDPMMPTSVSFYVIPKEALPHGLY